MIYKKLFNYNNVNYKIVNIEIQVKIIENKILLFTTKQVIPTKLRTHQPWIGDVSLVIKLSQCNILFSPPDRSGVRSGQAGQMSRISR